MSSSSSQNTYHYIIIREDLSIGQIGAQIAHAAGETGPAVPGTHAVVLSVRNERELEEVSARLYRIEVEHHLVIEENGEMMAIGLYPTKNRDRFKVVTDKLSLLGDGDDKRYKPEKTERELLTW